jgi:hypothetical protein
MLISKPRHALAPLAGAVLLCLARPAAAAGQVSRCEGADGSSVYTDHRCADVGAVARAADPMLSGNRRVYRGGCARNLQDLMFEMSTAIDARDPNRLANVYHWTGMSGSGGYAVMNRLEAVVKRPLVDIVPVMASPPEPRLDAALASVSQPAPGLDAAEQAESLGAAMPLEPAAPVATDYYPVSAMQAPVALRVVQTLEDGSTPVDTTFDLHEHFGCVWIKG